MGDDKEGVYISNNLIRTVGIAAGIVTVVVSVAGAYWTLKAAVETNRITATASIEKMVVTYDSRISHLEYRLTAEESAREQLRQHLEDHKRNCPVPSSYYPYPPPSPEAEVFYEDGGTFVEEGYTEPATSYP